jgi:two-component system response regulator AtoC
MADKRVLVVDDEASMRRNIIDILLPRGCEITEAADGVEAIERFKENSFDLVLLDINLPKKDGLSVLAEIKELTPDVPVILLTAYGTSERAIQGTKGGAYDYIEKPFELDEFIATVDSALAFSRLIVELNDERIDVPGMPGTANMDIVGHSPSMRDIFKLIGRIASSDAAVLIQGESGTGKELIANAIQRHSLRQHKPYVKVNCGALAESVLESEIFGHEKGSFTGAVGRRLGKFELADGGTILLDEVNSMPPSLQVRLLRVLEQHSFYRVGGEDPVRVNVRVLALSNRDLEHEVKNETFRKDLFYRLNVVRIDIPPLAERREDIPLLVKYFLHKYSANRELVVPPVEMKKLMAYAWPGNVRELENTIQRAIVMARESVIVIDELPMTVGDRGFLQYLKDQLKQGQNMKTIVADLEKKLILHALEVKSWSRTDAANYLGIHRRLLYSKMKEHGLSR